MIVPDWLPPSQVLTQDKIVCKVKYQVAVKYQGSEVYETLVINVKPKLDNTPVTKILETEMGGLAGMLTQKCKTMISLNQSTY